MTGLTQPTCSYCGAAFTEANPASRFGMCTNAWACVERKWAIDKAEKAKGGA